MLGNGMYNVVGGRYAKFRGSFGLPKMILQLHMEYDDGTSMIVASDAAWKAAAGPFTFSCIYGGEDYDARRETPGWDRAGSTTRGGPRPKLWTVPAGDSSPDRRRPSR